ncbi:MULTISPECIES: cobalamin-binding protein [Pseudomonas]|uniref:cobalamin-binding protein n=1 Tax=Pseudomonas TaxID=286 RepID=UPI0013A76D9A|nr:cobalamin-binding protein [Pseudomonas sp. OIL-1]QIB50750.1 cobalamin-binding protein [Pseudomonas sp. OIL-1]
MRGWLLAGLFFHSICVPAAERVVSLAPFLTDIVIMLDATERLVGVLDEGQRSAELDAVPRVGGHQSLSLELIVSQKPDLVLAWESGNPPALLSRLEGWGIQVLRFDPKDLESIASAVEQLGDVLQVAERAAAVTGRYNAALSQLAVPVGDDAPRVFIQLWDDPIYTVSGNQLIGDAVNHCGGINVFDALPGLAPQVGREGVLAANPDLILVLADDGKAVTEWLDRWRRFPQLNAVRQDGLHVLDSDRLVRPTPDVLDGVAQLCELIARQRELSRAAN